MRGLRNGLWSESRNGRKIDSYRRNLQKVHIDRSGYLMTAENEKRDLIFVVINNLPL